MSNWKRAFTLLALGATIPYAHAQYRQVNLISDGAIQAANTEPDFLNAWGIAFSPTGPFWLNLNGSDLSNVYDGTGAGYPNGNPLSVQVPPLAGSAPTGIVFNPGAGFVVDNGEASGPSTFIFVTEDGVISGWNPTVDVAHGIPVVDNMVPDSNYKGAALAANHGQAMLYATNFHEGKVDVFDSHWNLVGAFTDPFSPSNYSPFGIANIDGFLIVTFAQADADRHDDVGGPGHGFVDIFAPNGRLLRRLISRGALNSPWGIALAPRHFGEFRDHLLIGNFGDGRINAFDIPSGHFDGPLRDDTTHRPIVIDGLWGLLFGNGHLAGDTDKLYFTAGPNDESDGLFGYVAATRGR